tara:strand:- start:1576 stop:1722 length:147 start_codon:yes stop_codon:yes gene_type:complete
MAKQRGIGTHVSIEPTNKATSIGNGNVKMSSMNKHKKRSYKKYRGQGK